MVVRCRFLCVAFALMVLQPPLAIGQDNKWKLQSDECTITEHQWKLIAWYLERAPYVEITEIVTNGAINGGASYFANDFVRQLTPRINQRIKTQTVDYSTVEGNVTDTQTYGWHGVRFQTGDNATTSPSEVVVFGERDTAASIKKRERAHNQTREDAPVFGSVVLVENTELVDKYLVGYPRRPFKHPRANFVIISYKNETNINWESNSVKILTRLWKYYGVLNAIIISACQPEEVGYFDPYVSVSGENTPDLESWGIFRWVPINLLNFRDDWLLRKDRDFNGFPVTATMFLRYPTSVLAKNLPAVFLTTHYARGVEFSNGFGGSDGLILGNLAKVLNFNTTARLPRSGSYGSRQANGSYTGSIGEILYGRADVSMNGRFIQEYDSPEIEFLFTVSADKMCVIAPAAERIPQWMAIFKCFNVYVWILLPVVTTLCGGFLFILKLWGRSKRKFTGINDSFSFGSVMVQIWVIMMGGTTDLPARTMERAFVGSCLLTNVIIIGTFQGSLTTSFSTVSYYKNVDTLHDLDATGLPIVTSSASLRGLFGDEKDATPVLKSLIKKLKIYEIDNPIHKTAYKRDMCSIERYSDIHIIIKTTFQRPDGSAFVHVVEECPRHYFLAYIVKKGWPLLPRFNYILSKFSEAGLLNLWYQQAENAFVVHHLITNRFDVYGTQAFTFHDIQTAFYILGIGLMACCLIFIFEVFIMPPKKWNSC